ncbi:hypothetical protein GCM10023331_23850 [Algivirga pacifica]|uniref:Uncharacterized protein n=1 Tax=Algivirga pacifica TaxID=1162670 RepID=A0ABP9DC75_9BACT
MCHSNENRSFIKCIVDNLFSEDNEQGRGGIVNKFIPYRLSLRPYTVNENNKP